MPDQKVSKRLEIQNDNVGGGGGGDGGGGNDGGEWDDFGGDFGGDFGDSTSGGDTSAIDIPTVEITGHRDDGPSAGPIPSGIDPQLVALNEDKGFSWECALHSVIGGWEAGLACSLLEDMYPKGEGTPPKQPDPPKTPAPAPPPPTVPPKPVPPPKVPVPGPAPVPKTPNNTPGWRGVGPPRMIPRRSNFFPSEQNREN
ncbi:MAG: hypothetical protein Q9169_005193 [Polycauliona sp. 2 TL-2023]